MSFPESSHQHEQSNDEDSENPALMVVPGSSESMSGVSSHCDFISCLPGHLSKRILGNKASVFLSAFVKIHRTHGSGASVVFRQVCWIDRP